MDVLVESPPPAHTKRPIPGDVNDVRASASASVLSQSNGKRRIEGAHGFGSQVSWNDRHDYNDCGGVAFHGVQGIHVHAQRFELQTASQTTCTALDVSPSENLPDHYNNVASKRTRHHHEVPSQQARQIEYFGAQVRTGNGTVQETLYKALKALFPGMSDETIAHVLEACGDDVDAAIRRLNELQLETMIQTKDGLEEKGERGKEDECSISTTRRSVKAGWVDAIVSEMSAARDVEDARRRAAGVLERVLEDHEKDLEKEPEKGNRGCGLQHSQVIETLQKENALLKRAVGIQNGKIHELGEKCKGADELLAKFEEMKERCQALELHNYSLQVHLKQATSRVWEGGSHGFIGHDENGGHERHNRNPDVY